MANKLSEILKPIAENNSLSEDENFKSLMDQVSEIEVDDNILNAFEDTFLTMARAKNNEEVASKFKMQYLTTVDRRAEKALSKAGFNDDDLQSFKSEKDSLTKFDIFTDLMKTKFSDNTNSDTSADNEALNKSWEDKLNKMSVQHQVDISDRDKLLLSKDGQLKAQAFDFKYQSDLSKFTFSDNLERSDASMLIKKRLDAKPYDYKFDSDKGSVTIYDKGTDMEAFDGNKKLVWDDLVASTASSYIKKSDSGNPPKPKPTDRTPNNSGKYTFGVNHSG